MSLIFFSGSTYADNTNVDQKGGTLGDAAMNRDPIEVILTTSDYK